MVLRPILLLLSFLAVDTAFAQRPSAADGSNYPQRPVRLVVNAPPGGGTDILARMLAQHLSETFGQQIVVDNRAGGGGIIGTETVARAQPDGYTLLMAFTSHVINASLYPKLPYDTLKDFAPVAFAATVPNIVVVHPAVPVTSVTELIAYARARPGKVAYASAGVGSSNHLAGVMLETMSAIKLLHVPYKGGAPAQADVIAGQVPLAFANAVSSLPHVRSGKLRALATTGLKRSRAVPELPTLDEAGVKGYEANSWFGMFAPARVSDAILVKINAEIRRGIERPEMQERLARQGAEPNLMTVPEFGAFVRNEVERWGKVVKASGARVD
ncbi:MAG: tripartite tricarboxylate transporter substrate binding protein [Burkholderiales bacterium]|nr:tripartite tricarboxylate transporter substrate binding protein [Burkholderiales bacterium]